MNYIKTHLFYIILIGLALVAGRAWLQEHDSRLVAETSVKESQARVKDLEGQVVAIKTAADARVKDLQAQARAIKTPAQAIAAIPDVSNIPLRPLPAGPTSVTVEAIPLYQELAACRVTEVKLNACEKTAEVTQEAVKEKDIQIAALKKKPGFFKRLGGTLKTGGTGVVIGILIKAVLL